LQVNDEESIQTYSDELDALAEIYPSIKGQYAYQFNKNPERIDDFIHQKYGPQFSSQDTDLQFGIQ
jgi:hypothetical protein